MLLALYYVKFKVHPVSTRNWLSTAKPKDIKSEARHLTLDLDTTNYVQTDSRQEPGSLGRTLAATSQKEACEEGIGRR